MIVCLNFDYGTRNFDKSKSKYYIPKSENMLSPKIRKLRPVHSLRRNQRIGRQCLNPPSICSDTAPISIVIVRSNYGEANSRPSTLLARNSLTSKLPLPRVSKSFEKFDKSGRPYISDLEETQHYSAFTRKQRLV